eukprot:8877658-Pyramimonas_sp.AAC.1
MGRHRRAELLIVKHRKRQSSTVPSSQGRGEASAALDARHASSGVSAQPELFRRRRGSLVMNLLLGNRLGLIALSCLLRASGSRFLIRCVARLLPAAASEP